jgi:uncharacterized protein YggE
MVRIAPKTMVGAALIALAGGASAQTTTRLQPGETLLEVQAEGTATYLPDAAFITAGVVSTGTTATEATEANARTMTAVIAALKKAGVGERYIRTQQINVQPRFARMGAQDYEGQAQITGYVARNSVAVTVTKLSLAPEVIGAAFAAGANSVNGPNLGNQDTQVGVAPARSNAIVNAMAEAIAYAKGFGMKVARVLRISERGNQATQVSFAMARASYDYAPPAPPAPPPPVAGGEMKRSVTVWVDYALTPDK